MASYSYQKPKGKKNRKEYDMAKVHFRIEKDTLGEVKVPRDARWGAQTQRALENFPISGIRFPRRFIKALGMVKLTAAETNMELGLLNVKLAHGIMAAAQEVLEGKWDDQFVVDIFQTGSGTSTNMNANEVIANRTNEILSGKGTSTAEVHPNDHVNMGQSSNDVIPTCIHIATLESVEKDLLPALNTIHSTLSAKQEEFHNIIKVGRTHLQDAVPIRLGQEFGGYASMIAHAIRRVEMLRLHISELTLGGTAVGTGLNTHKEFPSKMIGKISKLTGLPFREVENHFEAQGSRDALVEASGALKTVAVSLMKIANDIRWASSGPRCGLGELKLPYLQPGSSIMPGKINPIIAEMVSMVAAQVIGYDVTITYAGSSGNFELNVMMPVMAFNLLESIRLLSNATHVFSKKCIVGISVDREKIEEQLKQSLSLATALTPLVGYEKASAIVKKALATGKTIREVAEREKVISHEELEKILDPYYMVEPHK
jgi:fumarate hydratase class II